MRIFNGIVGSAVYLILMSSLVKASPLPMPSQEIEIWQGPAPGLPDNPGEEKQEANGRVSNVSKPTLDVYLPEGPKVNGMAIIVCSGGAYARLAARPLGQYAAEKFLPLGITVFSLKYRLKPPMNDVKAAALADVQQAIRLVRSRALEWHLDPKRVGLVGFSAGSHLILNLCAHSDDGNPNADNTIFLQSCRPDFVGLFSTWSGGEKIGAFKIDSTVPPAFINHTKDDGTAPYAFSEEIAAAWKAAGRPVSLELYDQGGHMAFNFPGGHSGEWPEKFIKWLREQGLLSAP